MKTINQTILLVAVLMAAGLASGQEKEEKKFSAVIGTGYFRPILDEEGVMYDNAEFAPEIGFGLSYFASFDYTIADKIKIGLGYNGNWSSGEFIRYAKVNGYTVDGYLQAGAVANSNILLNINYDTKGDNFRPFAKLGLGYFSAQVEMGDVPISITDNVEKELFPDYKSSGFGALPEIGISYKSFTLSAAYNLYFTELKGEKIADVPPSVGSMSSQGVQINLSYRFLLF